MRVTRVSRADLLVAVSVAVLTIASSVAAMLGRTHVRPLWPWGILLIAVPALALALRRVWTDLVLVVAVVATALYYLLGYPDGPAVLPLMVALFAAAQLGRLNSAIIAAAAAAAIAAIAVAFQLQGAPEFVDMVAYMATLALAVALGELVRARAERLAASRRRAVDAERLRIARELHDLLAHQLSLINVLAAAALHRRLPEQAFDALGQIKEASRNTLRELRVVLGALRSGQDDTVGMPGIARLSELIARTESAGLPVRLDVAGTPGVLPAAVDLAAYRIIQEALTNVLRHAGPCHAVVGLRYGENTLEVRIDDDGRGVTPGRRLEGHGLNGMRERALGVGGTLAAGAGAHQGFHVRAVLPIGAGVPATTEVSA